MRFFELISMLFPVFMIILFIIVFIKKSISTRKNAGKKPPEQPRYAAPASALNTKPWLGRFPEIPLSPSEAPPRQQRTEDRQSSDSLHVMENGGTTSEENKAAEEATSTAYYNRAPGGGQAPPRLNRGLENVNRLPELKKAVIWAEILGKPKGLE